MEKVAHFLFSLFFLGRVLYIQDNFKPVIILPLSSQCWDHKYITMPSRGKAQNTLFMLSDTWAAVPDSHPISQKLPICSMVRAGGLGEVSAPQRVGPTPRVGVKNLQVAELHSIHHVLGNISKHLVYPSARVGCASEQEVTISNTEPSHSYVPLCEDLSYPWGH